MAPDFVQGLQEKMHDEEYRRAGQPFEDPWM